MRCRGSSRRGWIGGSGAHHRGERFDGQFLELRYPSLGDAEFDGDGFVRAITQPRFDDGGLGLRQLAGEAQDLYAQDCVLGCVARAGRRVVSALGVVIVERIDVLTVGFVGAATVHGQRDVHRFGDFVLFGFAAEFRAEPCLALLLFARETAEGARQGIEAAEVVEHGSADAMIGEGSQLGSVGSVVAIYGLDESDGAGGDEVFEGDGARALAVNLAGDEADEREMVEDALFARGVDASGMGGVGHGCTSSGGGRCP